MTCGHCVAAVREELAALAGVRSVDVELESGEVTVVSDAPAGARSRSRRRSRRPATSWPDVARRLSRSRTAPARSTGRRTRRRPSTGSRSSVTRSPSAVAELDGEPVGEVAALPGRRPGGQRRAAVGVGAGLVVVVEGHHDADVAARLHRHRERRHRVDLAGLGDQPVGRLPGRRRRPGSSPARSRRSRRRTPRPRAAPRTPRRPSRIGPGSSSSPSPSTTCWR